MTSAKKIRTLDELVTLRAELKQQGKTVVTTNGSYDIIHAGHVLSLEESKEQGDVLIVGINSDSSVQAYKSPDRPIIPEAQRAQMVAGLESVDYVFIFGETDPIAFLNELQPDVHTNSSDYGEDCIEKDTVLEHGGTLHLLKKYDGISTTEIIDKILTIYCKEKK